MDIESTGVKVEARDKYHNRIPEQRDGEHLWVLTGLWRVLDPGAGQYHMDTENLLSIDGPGCFFCEREWSSRLALRRCPGEPR